MGEFPGGSGFFGGLLGVVGSIASFIGHFLAITAKDILKLLSAVRDGIVTVAKQLVIGLWRLGRSLARALRSLAVLAFHGVKTFLTWTYQQILKLHTWLKEFFGPILKRLKELKDRIQAFYKTFVRPIIDAIEFIRQLNRILQVFHINLLTKLDTTLQQIEQRIEQPFTWVTQKITWLENWIDRIVTLDGLFQRVTLIMSMSRYAPAWMNGFWNRQIDKDRLSGDDYSRGREYPSDAKWANGKELAQFFRGEDNRMQAHIERLVPTWRIAAGVDPPDGAEG
jgi:hypothetical protein